ncbi:MAG: hypothetical protein HQL91_01880 [Magnetococcales bacterium]|nr:hypothetical protein [Magnetococcales bacterium]
MHFYASAWAEFQKHLTLPTANTATPIRTTAEPALYFNERSLYFVNINSRLYDAIPGFLTGGGIFGTFVGLVAGIYLAQDGMSAGPQEMKQAMKFLMGGVSTAFLTSIFGIGLSILFSVLEKRRQHWVGRLVQRFSEQLESCLEMSHDENSGLSRIYHAQMEQVSELRKLCQILKTQTLTQSANPGGGEMDARIGASLAPAMGKMFETLIKYQDNQRASHQQSLQSALAPLLESFQGTLAEKLSSIELGLFALNENLRKQHESQIHLHESQTGLIRDLRESGQEGLLNTAEKIREAMDGLGANMSTLLRESAEGSFGRLDQAIGTLTHAIADMKGGQQQLHKDLVGEFTRIESGRQGQADQNLQTFERQVSNIQTNLDQQNERLAHSLKEAALALKALMEQSGNQLATNQRHSFGELDAILGRSVSSLADVATGMKRSQLELAAVLKDSTVGMSGRLERTIADLADVAAGMRGAQMEMSALLRDSSAGLAGRMERTITDLGSVAAGMKSAQMELVALLRESANSFSGQMGNSLRDLSQSSTAMLAVQNEMQRIFGAAPHLLVATEKLLTGMERFQDHIGTKIDTMGQIQAKELAAQKTPEQLLEEMNRFMHQSRSTSEQESNSVANTLVVAGELILHAAESLEQTAAGMASHFATSINQLSNNNAMMVNGIRQSSDQTTAQMIDSIAALRITMDGVNHTLGAVQHLVNGFSTRMEIQAVPAPQGGSELQRLQGRFEEILGGILHFVERMDANHQATVHSINDRNQAVTSVLHQSQQHLNTGKEELETLLQATAVSFHQSASEINQAANRMAQALQNSTRWTEESRHAIEGVVGFSRSFDQAQGRFGQLIDAMESGAMMIAVAGEKLQISSDKLELASNTLTASQETARQTLAAITKAHEQLRTLWHNYESRFVQVDESLGRTFVNLNNGLHEFSERVLAFISGVDDHMGGISEKLGYSIGDFGSKLEEMNDNLSEFLEKMSSILIKPIQEAARQVALAGNRIHATMQSVEEISNTVSISEGKVHDGAQQTLAAFQEAQERMKNTIAVMQNQLQATWVDHQSRFEQVNASMQQTMASINSDLEDFSSEKVLEFIGGVDEHMESVSQQLRDTIGDFNTKLDDLNDSMSFFIQTLSSVK